MKLTFILGLTAILGVRAFPNQPTEADNENASAVEASSVKPEHADAGSSYNITNFQNAMRAHNLNLDNADPFTFNLTREVGMTESPTKGYPPNKGRDETYYMTIRIFNGRQHVGQWRGHELYQKVQKALSDGCHEDKCDRLSLKFPGLEANNGGNWDNGGFLTIGRKGFPVFRNPTERDAMIDAVAWAYQAMSEDPANCYTAKLRDDKGNMWVPYYWCQVAKSVRIDWETPDPDNRNKWRWGGLEAELYANFPTHPDLFSCRHSAQEGPILDNLMRNTRYKVQDAYKDKNGKVHFYHFHVDCD